MQGQPQDPSKWYVEVYNLPEHFNKEDIVYFIWKALQKCRGLKKTTNPITKSDYIQELKCVRVFFRSKEEILNCLDLNGILYGEKVFYMKSPQRAREHPFIEAKGLQIKRLNTRVEDSFNKLCIQGLPAILEFEVINILRSYGELKSFQPMYTDKVLTNCFFQYQTSEAAEECLSKLNNSKIKMKTVMVKRAIMAKEGSSRTTVTRVKQKSSLFQKDPHSFYLTFDTVGYFKQMKISCVLLLRNIISSSGDKEFIKEDIKREVSKIGRITRFVNKDKNIYIQYDKVEYAEIAYLLLINRKYEGRNFDVTFYDPLNFSDDILL